MTTFTLRCIVMAQDCLYAIVGLGATGLSCARYLGQKNIPFVVMDTRLSPPNLDEFKKLFPYIPLSLGKLDDVLLDQASHIILSPGLSLQHPAIARQLARGVPIIGDIELFALGAKV